MGTPDFAVPCLRALAEAGHQLIGVVTQPDRPKGRGRQLTASPVKLEAQTLGLPVYQPEKVKSDEFTAFLRQMAPELIVVVAFGQLLSPDILAIPRYGCVNVHASLLPKYRGAAPIHRAVIAGEKVTGVTTMQMDSGMDTGEMIFHESVPIAAADTVGIVHDKLAAVGACLLAKTIAEIERGTAPHIPQDDAQATYAPMLDRALERIHWNRPAEQVSNLVRGMDPWPGAYTMLGDKVLKIWRAVPLPEESCSAAKPCEAPGTVLEILPGRGLVIQTGQGRLLVEEVQFQGSRRMKVEEFLRGHPLFPGILLG